MAGLPSGTVTFLFTDIEASTRRWEADESAMNAALLRHDQALREAIESCGGHLVKSTGDGVLAVFDRATAALDAAAAGQRALSAEELPSARMAVHTGEAFERGGDYYGSALNRAARLMAIGHGGQVLVSTATALVVTGFELLDLGEHRLRDLSRPEHVYQLCGPSLSDSFPPLRSVDSYPTNLPPQMTVFVGRHDDVREAVKALGQYRVVTLTGVGGVGKTRLALQVGAELLQEFADGVFVVELGGIADVAAVDESVAAALAVRQQPGQTLSDSVMSFLANKHMLVVVDNCEHLLDAASRLVSLVLALAPNVRVLATSRESLRVDGEQVISVPSLSVPDGNDVPDTLVDADAVRLFVERAHAVRSNFELNADNAAAVAQLCRRLDGIPLAIELAAARVRSMSPMEIAARLDQRFRLLTGGTRSSANRHQTLRRAIDWSYELLERDERTVLGRLAVCVGGFDLAAAEAIAADDDIDTYGVDDAVGHLVDKSLVTALELGGITRFKMLETVRDYALERLDASGDLARVRSAHAEFFSGFAQIAGSGLKGPQERDWLARIDEEIDNLRAAVSWSLASDNAHVAVVCVCALGLQGLRIEPTMNSWAASIAASGLAEHEPGYPVVLAVTAWSAMAEGRGDDARRFADASIERLEGAPPELVCLALSPITGTEPMTGRDPGEHARRWLEAAEQADDAYQRALATNLVAISEMMNGDTDRAAATIEASLDAARTSGSPSAIAYCCFSCALILGQKDPVHALRLLDESRDNALAADNDYALVIAGGVRSTLLSQSGDDLTAARCWLEQAIDAARAGRRDVQALALTTFAASIAALGQVEPAAVTLGWTESALGTIEPSTNYNLGKGAQDALHNLPLALGVDRYAALMARGARMSADDALDYARQQLL